MAFKTIMVAVAGGPASVITAKYAVYLAKVLQAKLIAVNVVNKRILQELLRSRVVVDIEAHVYERDLEEQGKSFLERMKKFAESKGVDFQGLVRIGIVNEEIVKEAKELQTDLLVIGQLKEIVSRKEIYYDEGERILRDVHCPVVIIKNTEEVQRILKEL